ncbi:MAG: BrnT family toxin [Rhodospirillales bacterium]|nr:BrnT family toxin [Rhodospirillales bacterium]
MEFEWDEAKSEACYAERGFDFAYAIQVFLDPDRLVDVDDRFEYGEVRHRVLGRIEGRVFVVVYTVRGHRFRIISAHKANRREVRRYEAGPRDAHD